MPEDMSKHITNHMNEYQFMTLRELSKNKAISQRELSRNLGISLGKVNYLINELLKAGYIKAKKFKNSNNKIAYMYILTPKGINTKIKQTQAFLQRKLEEYNRLEKEIASLRQELDET